MTEQFDPQVLHDRYVQAGREAGGLPAISSVQAVFLDDPLRPWVILGGSWTVSDLGFQLYGLEMICPDKVPYAVVFHDRCEEHRTITTFVTYRDGRAFLYFNEIDDSETGIRSCTDGIIYDTLLTFLQRMSMRVASKN